MKKQRQIKKSLEGVSRHDLGNDRNTTRMGAYIIRRASERGARPNSRVLPSLQVEPIKEIAAEGPIGPLGRLRKQGGKVGFLLSTTLFLLASGSTFLPRSEVLAETLVDIRETERGSLPYAPDNTGKNVRDRQPSAVTADDQRMTGPSVDLLSRIRREITANDKLSNNGQNVKIVVGADTIVLRGPVASAEEKSWISQVVAKLAPKYAITNQLEIVPSK